MKNLTRSLQTVFHPTNKSNVFAYKSNNATILIKAFFIPNNHGLVISPINISEDEFELVGVEIGEKLLQSMEHQGNDMSTVNAFFNQTPTNTELFIRRGEL